LTVWFFEYKLSFKYAMFAGLEAFQASILGKFGLFRLDLDK